MSTTFVLVHGAFRGGWAWDKVRAALDAAGHDSVAPTLTGCESASPRIGSHVSLHEWVQDVVDAVDAAEMLSDDIILVAHSQAGLPSRVALDQLGTRLSGIVYLDAAVPTQGERGIDLNPPGVPAPPSGLDRATWIPAREVGPGQGFSDPELAKFVNERLVPTPLGPSLDAVSLATESPRNVVTTYVFCSKTPTTYPCRLTQQRLDREGVRYIEIESAHDAPLTAPGEVVRVLLSLT